MLVNNRATLLYLTQLGNIEEHAWLAPARDLDHPDWVVFDLDPGKAEFDTVCEVALALHQVLNGLGLKSYAKTSSAGGLHVYVPIERRYAFAETADFAERIATRPARCTRVGAAEMVGSERPDTAHYFYLKDHAGPCSEAGRFVFGRIDEAADTGQRTSAPEISRDFNRPEAKTECKN